MVPGALLGLWFDRERPVRASLGRMSTIELRGVAKRFGATPVLTDVDLDRPRRVDHGRARGVGQRQDDAAAADRRVRAGRCGHGRDRRPHRRRRGHGRCGPSTEASATSPRKAPCSPT